MNDSTAAASTPIELVQGVYGQLDERIGNARSRLDQTAELFPEFVASAQDRLAERLALQAETEAVEVKAHAGTTPEGVAEVMLHARRRELKALRTRQASQRAVSLLRRPNWKKPPCTMITAGREPDRAALSVPLPSAS